MSVRRCLRCHNWSKCSGYSYFTPGEVDGHWCWSQVVFLVLARDCLFDMSWPQEPSDYIEQGKSTVRASATFEGSLAVVCGEFNRRWARLIRSKQARRDVGTLDHELAGGLELRALSPAARSVVEYLIKPHWMLYHDWLNQRWGRNEGSSTQKIMPIAPFRA